MDNTVKGFQTDEGTKQYDYNALANLPTLISQDNIDESVANALAQAKQNGDFKGDKGDDYILTEADKAEIAEIAAELIDIPDSPGGGDIDLDGYATQQWVQDQNYLKSIPSEYVTSTELKGEVDSALAQAKESGDFKGEPGDDYILTEQDKQDIANLIEVPSTPGGGDSSGDSKVIQIPIEVDENGYGTSLYGSDEIQDLLEQGYIVYVWCENMVYPLLYANNSMAQFMNTERSGRLMITNVINIDINKSAKQSGYLNLYTPYVSEAGQYIFKYSSNGVTSWVDFDAAVVESVTNNFTNVSQEGA